MRLSLLLLLFLAGCCPDPWPELEDSRPPRCECE